MNDAAPLVGVVIPVFNGEPYIAEAIESVLNQTYPNWKLVVSDNVSTDGTREVVQRYADRDERVTLRTFDEHVPFLQSWNRAVAGLPEEAAYCKVLCADDMLYPQCLEKMVDVAERHPNVGIVGAYRRRGDEVSLKGIDEGVEVVPGRELGRTLLLGGMGYIFGSPSSTLFRGDLVRKRRVFYDETNLHADTAVCYDVLQESDFGFVHDVLTFTRLHDEAITRYTQRVGSYRPEHLRMLARYGRYFLSAGEYRRRLAAGCASYLSILASPRRWRSLEFRRFHTEMLRRLGRELPAGDVSRGIAIQLRRLPRRWLRPDPR